LFSLVCSTHSFGPQKTINNPDHILFETVRDILKYSVSDRTVILSEISMYTRDKAKVVPVFLLIKHHTMEAYLGEGV
jgi:hypothetical protein